MLQQLSETRDNMFADICDEFMSVICLKILHLKILHSIDLIQNIVSGMTIV